MHAAPNVGIALNVLRRASQSSRSTELDAIASADAHSDPDTWSQTSRRNSTAGERNDSFDCNVHELAARIARPEAGVHSESESEGDKAIGTEALPNAYADADDADTAALLYDAGIFARRRRRPPMCPRAPPAADLRLRKDGPTS